MDGQVFVLMQQLVLYLYLIYSLYEKVDIYIVIHWTRVFNYIKLRYCDKSRKLQILLSTLL